MRKHAQNSHAHVNNFSKAQKQFILCRWLYYTPNIKLKIMLYEPFLLKMVWKSKESVWKFESGKVSNFEMENV